MEIALQFIMDLVVLVALGVTMFYAMRLSNSLNAFKKNKAEFEETVRTLSVQIDNAYEAIGNLKQASGQIGDDFQESISDAKYMLDELRQVNEVSDSLAHRLEVLAQKGRQSYAPSAEDNIAPAAEEVVIDQDAGGETEDTPPKVRSWKSALSGKGKPKAKGPEPAKEQETASVFSIRDPDYDAFSHEDSSHSDEASSFASQAEKDLYEVLKSRKR